MPTPMTTKTTNNSESLLRCQCGAVFGGRCDSEPVQRSELIEVDVIEASDVESAKAAGSTQGYVRRLLVNVGCHDAIEALDADQFFDEYRDVVIGMRA